MSKILVTGGEGLKNINSLFEKINYHGQFKRFFNSTTFYPKG